MNTGPFKRSDFPVSIEIALKWGEMDALQHINNVAYFRYFECARIAYFDSVDYMGYQSKTGLGPILASTSCKFIRPLFFPDDIWVGSKVTRVSVDRFNMRYAIVSRKTGELSALSEAAIVSFDYQKQCKAPIPEVILAKIRELEGDRARQ